MSDDELNNSFPVLPPSQNEVDAFVIGAGLGQEAVVAAYLDKYEGYFLERKTLGTTALINAVGKGQHKIVETLVQHGADVNGQGSFGQTPLMWAARKGAGEMAMFLIEKGASIHLQDVKGQTAAMMAREKGHVELAKVLELMAERKIEIAAAARLEKLKARRPKQSPFRKGGPQP